MRLRSSSSSRQIGPSVDQYGTFRDVSLVPFADWSGRTPQSDYLLSSREGAIFVRRPVLSRTRDGEIVIDTYAKPRDYYCMKPERIPALYDSRTLSIVPLLMISISSRRHRSSSAIPKFVYIGYYKYSFYIIDFFRSFQLLFIFIIESYSINKFSNLLIILIIHILLVNKCLVEISLF